MPRRSLPAFWLLLSLLLLLATPVLASPVASAPAGPGFVPSRVAAFESVNPAPASAFVSFADPRFEPVWARTDLPVARTEAARSWLWGPSAGDVHSEPFGGAPGGARTVQYFDKARMEVNPAITDPSNQWSVTTGLLVVELVSGRIQTGAGSYETRSPADVAIAGDYPPPPSLDTAPRYSSFHDLASLPGGPDRKAASAVGAQVVATVDRSGRAGTAQAGDLPATVKYSLYMPETGHNVPDVFARFMQSQGLVYEGGAVHDGALFDAIYLLGYPITEAYWTTVPISGKPVRVLVQLYQRRALTYVPSFSPEWQVQMGNVGAHYFSWRYGASGKQGSTSAPANPGSGAAPGQGSADTFVHISGNRLVYGGQSVKLKGSNFWTHDTPFADTWVYWNGPAVKSELAKAKELGDNVIRVGIPFGNGRSTDVVWGTGCFKRQPNCTVVNGNIINEMMQFLQIASGYDMKVIFTLYEWADTFPLPGQRDYNQHVAYLQGIVTPFANDDRVFAWDLHNEPDNYDTWPSGPGSAGVKQVIAWTANMAGILRSIDQKHPVTVGVGNVNSLWAQGSSGSAKLMDIVDLVSFHCYDAGGFRSQITAAEAHTSKPILLEEMGWPTGPSKLSNSAATYDEATQQFLYHSMLGDAKASTLVGVIQWALWDNVPTDGSYFVDPSVEPYFGLVRLDGTFKPAASDFKNSYPSSPLPSTTRTDLPLTKSP